MKQSANYFLHPTEISEIKPVYDNAGYLKSWNLTVTFNNPDVEPPHAKGAHVSSKNVGNKTLAEYRFSECVMKKGLRQALLFREAISLQIARQNSER